MIYFKTKYNECVIPVQQKDVTDIAFLLRFKIVAFINYKLLLNLEMGDTYLFILMFCERTSFGNAFLGLNKYYRYNQ